MGGEGEGVSFKCDAVEVEVESAGWRIEVAGEAWESWAFVIKGGGVSDDGPVNVS